eukprot:6173153-Pleurochrysis_carterae.AAC.1
MEMCGSSSVVARQTRRRTGCGGQYAQSFGARPLSKVAMCHTVTNAPRSGCNDSPRNRRKESRAWKPHGQESWPCLRKVSDCAQAVHARAGTAENAREHAPTTRAREHTNQNNDTRHARARTKASSWTRDVK